MDREALEKRKKIVYEFICDDLYVPMKAKEIAMILQVSKEQREELHAVLDALLEEGKVELTQKGKYVKASGRFLTGVYTGNSRGFGFVTVEGEEEDIYIPEENTNGAMHMDTVSVAVNPQKTGKRREGRIIKIISRGLHQIVGTYQSSKNFGFVVPDNQKLAQDIFIPIERSKGAVDGHKVVVEITDYGKNGKKPEGKIVEILGHINDWQMVTIDGEDSKDLDDAVSLTMDGENYILGVHIADVSNYVQEHSALDVEALNRGTSVYLVDRVIPMLPHALSNGICSLNAGENRLALSCIMTINPKGKVIDHKIVESVVKIDRRMTYTAVKEILEDHNEETIAAYRELVPMFEKMGELAALLRGNRMKRGSIDFDFPETKSHTTEIQLQN